MTRTARNFFAHASHVPLVLLILEALIAQSEFWRAPDPYVLLAAAGLQAFAAAALETRGRRMPFLILLTNLAGPLFYSIVEAALEGASFFRQAPHAAYWLYAIGFGLLQSAGPGGGWVMAENLLRSSIPLVMYALFEVQLDGAKPSLAAFFADPAHVFLAVVLLLLGALLRFADIELRRSLRTIASLTARLREYSQWALGGGLLERAIADERVLTLQRVERAVLFMDIRGFTAWSERQTPEDVVAMLNRYYTVAEDAGAAHHPVKIKFTADEVMAVFASADEAIAAGEAMVRAAMALLEPAGLTAGCGVHRGALVEGVLGGVGSRAYDFIGDTVNTAQRLCDAARPGELLASQEACGASVRAVQVRRAVQAKGKSEPIVAAVITPAAGGAGTIAP